MRKSGSESDDDESMHEDNILNLPFFFSLKQSVRVATEANMMETERFLALVNNFPAECFAFLDESGKDSRDCTQKMARAPVGHTPICHQSMRETVRKRGYSVLGMIGIDGLLNAVTYKGGLNGEKFAEIVIDELVRIFPSINNSALAIFWRADDCCSY